MTEEESVQMVLRYIRENSWPGITTAERLTDALAKYGWSYKPPEQTDGNQQEEK
jgi:hypothetical protein